MKYNHAFDFAFEVNSHCEQATDVDAKAVRDALLSRVMSLSDKELMAAVSCFDTMEETKDIPSRFNDWSVHQEGDKIWTVPTVLLPVVSDKEE